MREQPDAGCPKKPYALRKTGCGRILTELELLEMVMMYD
jgi:hypothetical protein